MPDQPDYDVSLEPPAGRQLHAFMQFTTEDPKAVGLLAVELDDPTIGRIMRPLIFSDLDQARAHRPLAVDAAQQMGLNVVLRHFAMTSEEAVMIHPPVAP